MYFTESKRTSKIGICAYSNRYFVKGEQWLLSVLIKLCFISFPKAKLHFSRWNGFGKNHPVHYISLWDTFERNPWPFFGDCPIVHNPQLGEGVPHLDRVERGRVPWESSQSSDHSVVWNVLQRSPGKALQVAFPVPGVGFRELALVMIWVIWGKGPDFAKLRNLL